MGASTQARSPRRGLDPQLRPGHQAPQTGHPEARPALAGTMGSTVPRRPPETARSLGPAKLVSGWQTSAGQERSAKCDYGARLAFSFPPPASSQPHLSQRRRARREEGNQSLSRAETVLLQP